MPVYKGRQRETWRVVVWSRGQRHEQIVRGTRRAALEHEATWRLELGALDPTAERGGLMLAQLCERYLIARRAVLRAETWRVQRSQLASVCSTMGPIRAIDCTTARVEDFKAARSLASVRHTKRPVRRSTINNELRALRRVLSWGAETGYRVTSPKIRRLRQDAPRVRAFTADEMDRLYTAARSTSPTLLAMLIWIANTGMRRGEMLAAEWSWIDWDSGLIRIPCSSDWGPKSREAREVPLEPAVRAVLQPIRQPAGPVFRRADGGRYRQWPKDWWIPCRTAAGLTGGVHQLRHTYASHFLQRKPDLYLLGRVLGQKHARTTEMYAHLLPSHLEQARGAVALAPKLGTVAATVAVDRMAHRRRSTLH